MALEGLGGVLCVLRVSRLEAGLVTGDPGLSISAGQIGEGNQDHQAEA